MTLGASCRDTNFQRKTKKIDFGKRVCSDGVARYFLLSREGELPPINQVLDRKTDSDNLSMPYIRTSDDAKLMDKYPVLFFGLRTARNFMISDFSIKIIDR